MVKMIQFKSSSSSSEKGDTHPLPSHLSHFGTLLLGGINTHTVLYHTLYPQYTTTLLNKHTLYCTALSLLSSLYRSSHSFLHCSVFINTYCTLPYSIINTLYSLHIFILVLSIFTVLYYILYILCLVLPDCLSALSGALSGMYCIVLY